MIVASLIPCVLFAGAQDEDGAFPPCDLIADNVKATDVTAAVEITGVEKERVFRPDDGAGGYIIYRISARVFRCYKGGIKKDGRIVYRYLIEAGINPPKAGEKYIVSLKKKDKGLVVPDAGYSFEYSDRLDGLYKKAGNRGC